LIRWWCENYWWQNFIYMSILLLIWIFFLAGLANDSFSSVGSEGVKIYFGLLGYHGSASAKYGASCTAAIGSDIPACVAFDGAGIGALISGVIGMLLHSFLLCYMAKVFWDHPHQSIVRVNGCLLLSFFTQLAFTTPMLWALVNEVILNDVYASKATLDASFALTLLAALLSLFLLIGWRYELYYNGEALANGNIPPNPNNIPASSSSASISASSPSTLTSVNV